MPTTSDPIAQAKADFLRAKEQMARAFANTPDDRIAWSPSPTARTPAQIVAHAAMSVQHIQNFMDGTPFPIGTTAGADIQFRQDEQAYTDRAETNALLDKLSAAYVAWLDKLPTERLAVEVEAPFGMGMFPVGACIVFPAAQLTSHTAQIEYIQTIYGDRNW